MTNYKFTSSFVLALFLFPPPVHFIFASSKMFRAIKGWDYYFPLVCAKANSSIFTSVLLRIIPKITAKSIWTLRVTSPGVNTRKRRYGMRSLLSLSHMGRKKEKKKTLLTSSLVLVNTHKLFQEKLNSVSMSLYSLPLKIVSMSW